MKNRKLIILALFIAISGWAGAQEYKVQKNTGRLEINIGRVIVEGHSGNEIIFSSLEHRDKDEDDRSKGLEAINGSGLKDNTGLGINVSEKDNVVRVSQLKKMNSPDIKILVPKGMIISFEFESQYGGDAKFKNLENEIEVSAQYNSIELENITGPLTVKTIYGHVEADFNNNIKGPISIVSVYGYADVTLPIATKADLKLSTSYGEILVAPELKIEVENSGGMKRYSDQVSGKLNGGGMKIDITCNYGKVYLRKK
jgi:hypothetical protein